MLNKFPLWKNLLLIGIFIVGLIYTAPNIFGEDPAVQISGNTSKALIDNSLVAKVKAVLQQHAIKYKAIQRGKDNLLIRFYSTDAEFKASGLIKAAVDQNYTVALNLAPATPKWLRMLGAEPMKLGLDLRGGIHFLLDVDVQGVVTRRMQGLVKEIADQLRKARIRYSQLTLNKDQTIEIAFKSQALRAKAYTKLMRAYPNLTFTRQQQGGTYNLSVKFTPAYLQKVRQYTIDQTRQTLSNRVNELGIAEAIVQQQGPNRIAVDLPGVQDSARAKQILGGTATLEFHLVDSAHDVRSAIATGIAPPGDKVYYMTDGTPILLKNQVVLAGNSITSASSSFGQDGRPTVDISLGGGGEAYFTQVTRANVGKRMAIVYVETKTINKIVDGKLKKIRKKVEHVISAPVIQSALPSRFQITGLTDAREARHLALLLRAGAMPANIDIVEERNVGPSLGKENIHQGVLSVEIAFILIVLFMAFYYGVFGIFADLALVFNLILIIAILSLLGATLTLPGIAGIVLTLGMAVDANVLIFERIREELRNGVTPQASIHAGFERAFGTIVDANVTTLIVAVVLFSIGTGPVKGFAVTLTVGLLTSMFTAITFTRGLVNWFYGGKTSKRLSLGVRIK